MHAPTQQEGAQHRAIIRNEITAIAEDGGVWPRETERRRRRSADRRASQGQNTTEQRPRQHSRQRR